MGAKRRILGDKTRASEDARERALTIVTRRRQATATEAGEEEQNSPEEDGIKRLREDMSWGSRENLERAVRAVLAICARKYTSDDKIIRAMSDDKMLIDSIIDGRKAGRPPATDILRAHISPNQ